MNPLLLGPSGKPPERTRRVTRCPVCLPATSLLFPKWTRRLTRPPAMRPRLPAPTASPRGPWVLTPALLMAVEPGDRPVRSPGQEGRRIACRVLTGHLWVFSEDMALPVLCPFLNWIVLWLRCGCLYLFWALIPYRVHEDLSSHSVGF